MKVLIAEDDRVLSDVLSTRLRTSGFQVLTAYDAMQALMVAVRHVPSAIILDISMPAGTGLDVLAKLKRSNKTSLIPVIVLTGNLDPEMGTTVTGLGAAEYFTKPPDIEKIEASLNKLLGRAKATA